MNETAIVGVLCRRLEPHVDERGSLMEVYRTDWGDVQPAMAYVSMTLPGVERGPHEHRQQTDLLIFPGAGCFKLRLADNRYGSPTYGREIVTVINGDEPSVWLIPPGVMHGYRNMGTTTATTINLPDCLYAGKDARESVDEIRHEASGLNMKSERWTNP